MLTNNTDSDNCFLAFGVFCWVISLHKIKNELVKKLFENKTIELAEKLNILEQGLEINENTQIIDGKVIK